jgi:hypothetical protein
MTSRDTTPSGLAGSSLRRTRAALFLTTAVAAVALPQAVMADATLSGPYTPVTAQTAIDAGTTAAANTTTFDTTVVVSPGGLLAVGNRGGFGTTVITATNNGKLGTLNAGGTAVVDAVDLNIDATGTGTAGNTATVVNSGLITGQLYTGHSNYFASATTTNSGAVWGGIRSDVAGGDSIITTTSTGTVLGGAVLARSISKAATVTVAGGVTTVAIPGGGNATVIQDGNAVTVAGTRLNLTAQSQGGAAKVTVSAKAGTVTTDASGTKTTVNAAQATVANDANKVTAENDTVNYLGTSVVGIAATGDVTGVNATGPGGSTVTVDGKVGTGGISSTATNNDTFSKMLTSTDGANAITSQTVTSSNLRNGGTSAVTLNAGSAVAGGVTSTSDITATVLVGGKVSGGGVVADAQTGSNDTSTNTTTPTSTSNAVTQKFNASTADVTFASGSTLTGGDVTVSSYSKSTFTNNGKLFNPGGFGNVTVTANGGTLINDTTTNSTTSPGNSTASLTGSAVFNAGGTANFVNNGYIGGMVNVDGPLGVTILNAAGAQTAGTTDAKSEQETLQGTISAVSTSALSGTVTTATTTNTISGSLAATGGSVDGTYAGTSGEVNFAPTGPGTVTQTANKASKATVSGIVYGDVNSTAGTGTNVALDFKTVNTTITDTAALPASGSDSVVESSKTVTTSTAGGDSTVTVSGKVLDTKGGGNVTSAGTDSSTVTVSGLVSQDVSSTATGAYKSTALQDAAYSRTNTKGVFKTTAASDSSSTVTTVTGGPAVGNVTGTGKVGAFLDVSGVASASSAIDTGASVGQSLSVSTDGTDVNNTSSNIYAYDPATKVATIVSKSSNTSGPSAAVGDATATVAGSVGGDVNVKSTRGNTLATITGTVGNDINLVSNGTVTNTTTDFASTSTGFAGDARTSVGGLPVLTKSVTTTTNTAIGGTATVLVDTAAALQAKNVGNPAFKYSVGGEVEISGLSGASITVTKGSSIGEDAIARSQGATSVSTTTITPGGKLASTTTSQSTNVGKAASVTNAGVISTNDGDDAVQVYGTTSATVTNSGTINGTDGGFPYVGNVYATSLVTDSSQMTTNNDPANTDPITHTKVETITYTPVGGTTTVTNSGLITGDITAIGGSPAATNSVTNTGTVLGTIYVGGSVASGTTTTTYISTDTVTTPLTPPVTLFAQTYTVNQNSLLAGGVNVSGALYGMVKTSNIIATVNLNDKSVTLGDITAQQTPGVFGPAGFLTTTTLNLNGGGYLGLDYYSDPAAPASPSVAARFPEANLTTAQGALLGLPASSGTGTSNAANIGTRVLGATSINKTGAGTFVIVGTPYNTTAAIGENPWTWDIGSFNNNAGETQLTLGDGRSETSAPISEFALGSGTSLTLGTGTSAPSAGVFGVNGDINNAVPAGTTATLVVGRRVPIGISPSGNSLTTPGTEVIRGITINETGNFAQGSGGTLAVGLSPSLVRFANPGTGTVSTSSELLGIVTNTVSQPYFTIPSNNGTLQSTPSRVNVTGNVNLAGKVAVDTTNAGIYSDGDGYVLFTYTGTGTSTATVASNLTSPFVAFSLKNDTTAKTISLVTTRAGYNTFSGIANDENARNAAAGLNSGCQRQGGCAGHGSVLVGNGSGQCAGCPEHRIGGRLPAEHRQPDPAVRGTVLG